MSDAFESLRRPVVPLAPDPNFAARLRTRLAHDLEQSPAEGADMPDRPHHTLTAYLAVSPASDAITWYGEVFGASLRFEPIVMPDGRIGHAELLIGDSVLMLADAHPEIGHVAPTLDAGTHVTLTVRVDDADRVVESARRRGARVERDVANTEYEFRGGTIRDPFGHRWMVQSPVRSSSLEHGDLVHFSLHLPDRERAVEFYRSVLGWDLVVEEDEHTATLRGQSISGGIWSGPQTTGVDMPGIRLVWNVADIDAAIEAVRTAGGVSGEVERRPYGLVVSCEDSQGLGFSLHQDLPGQQSWTTPPMRQGDVEYVTIGSPDEQASAAFYRSVLGWQLQPGTVPHGYQVSSSTPLGGLWGGDPHRQRVQLMFRVDDVAAAVERVGRAGGIAGEVELMPYGSSVDCVDDQGLAFWLLQPPD